MFLILLANIGKSSEDFGSTLCQFRTSLEDFRNLLPFLPLQGSRLRWTFEALSRFEGMDLMAGEEGSRWRWALEALIRFEGIDLMAGEEAELNKFF